MPRRATIGTLLAIHVSTRSIAFFSHTRVSLLVLLAICQQAEASSLFFTDHQGVQGTIVRANLNGSLATDLFQVLSDPRDVSVDPGTGVIFWVNAGNVYSGRPDGSDSHKVETMGGYSIDVDTSLGYAFVAGSTLRRINLDGSGSVDVVATTASTVVLDAQNRFIYYCDDFGHRIRRAGLGGNLPTTIVSLPTEGTVDFDIDAAQGYVYFVRGERTIQRSPLNGAGTIEDIVTLPASNSIRRIALDVQNGHIYWTNGVTRKIQRSSLSGDDVTDIATSLGTPLAIDIGPAKLPVLGDTDGNGVVDVTDLNNVRNNFGETGLGDTNHDNKVDVADLNNVRNNFGARSSAASVPEPSTGLLLGMLVGICLVGGKYSRLLLHADS